MGTNVQNSIILYLPTYIMPPQQQKQAPTPGPHKDKEGYYRLGHTTLYFLLIKYGAPAIILAFAELILIGAAAGGNNLPPFSQWVSASPELGTAVRLLAGVVPGLVIIAVLIALAMALGYYYSFRYKLEDNDLSFERGLIGIQEISIPFRQIQNVDVEQSAVYRIFNIADLVILTAGHEDPMHSMDNETEIIMPALNAGAARDLKRYLLDRANVQRAVNVIPNTEPPEPPPLE